jgi:hypothetical protein
MTLLFEKTSDRFFRTVRRRDYGGRRWPSKDIGLERKGKRKGIGLSRAFLFPFGCTVLAELFPTAIILSPHCPEKAIGCLPLVVEP